ncbi:SRPBCC family protein [Antrihabitans cavernicola]|uniref:Polyketide cyclase n=1 Tax=Antrihabitans cavernicola TaxID=2495913 RepID=A0A5A7SCI8_9NOCA|nr:SRPBCC family protein [Spelaeibacter cavernicola]KAA0023606.1 polyketide cyclase [Spelaeibacter cavernicola]
MTDVRRTFTVNQSREKVVAFLQDFSNAEAWDPGTVNCARVGAGPLRVGARWHNVSKFRGRTTELDYELVRSEPGRLTFVGENKTVTSTDDLTFAEVAEGTAIGYHAHFEWHGLVKLAAPFVKGAIEELGDPTVAQMKSVLESLP